jgi:hypothetical protein
MTHVIANRIIQEPNLSKEQLVNYLVATDRRPLILKGIQSLYGVFKSYIKISITNKTKARYIVTAYIPLNDPMFQSDAMIDHVDPSKIGPHVQFTFEGYLNRKIMGRIKNIL